MMEFLNPATSFLLQRDVNLSLKPNHFRVVRSRFLSFNPNSKSMVDANKNCPFGDYIYLMQSGLEFDSSVADKAVELANQKHLQKLSNDLDFVPENQKGALRHLYRLGHALEHLTVYDLFCRELINFEQFSPDINHTLGGTARMNIASGLPFDLFSYDHTFFHIRRGLVSPDEEFQSVKNVVQQIKS